MNRLKLLGKKNMGSAGLLLFLVVVSQARLFDFLISSSLGRLILIITLLCLSYCHQMLGIVAVLFIVIAFNEFGINSSLTEGFDTTTEKDSSTTASTDKSKDKSKNTETAAAAGAVDVAAVPTTSASTKAETDNATEIHNATRGLEGFDVLGIENNLKRGKQSNTIPVSSYSSQDSDFISAYESTSSIFGNLSFF